MRIMTDAQMREQAQALLGDRYGQYTGWKERDKMMLGYRLAGKEAGRLIRAALRDPNRDRIYDAR